MAVYPNAVAESLERLEYSGSIPGDAYSGQAVNFDCGGFVAISIEISEDSGIITSAGFRSNGCGFMVAAAETVCAVLNGAEVTGLQGLETLGASLEDRFGPFPTAWLGCFDAVIEGVKASFREHRDQVVAEFAGEKALICTCFGISEETILKYITNARPSTAQEVSDACHAGSGCGSCRMIIQELIDTAERERVMTKS